MNPNYCKPPCRFCNDPYTPRSWLRFILALLVVAGFGPLALLFYSWKAALGTVLLALFCMILLLPLGLVFLLHPFFMLLWVLDIGAAGYCTYPEDPATPSFSLV